MGSSAQDFRLGIDIIDREHAELARLFHDFARCIREGGSFADAQQIVQQALAAANDHFEHEEAIMVETAYPGIEEEKRHHRNLRLQFTTLVGDCLNTLAVAEGPADPVTLENLADMQRLLAEHIQGPDKDLADYLKKVGYQEMAVAG